MALMYFALIGGALFYLARIVLEYRDHEMTSQPHIERLEAQIETLRERMEQEIPLREEVKDRVTSLRGLENDRRVELDTLKEALLAEEGRYKDLVLEIQKRQFRGTLQRGRRLMTR